MTEKRLVELVGEAVRLPRAEREEFVRRVADEDPELGGELRAILGRVETITGAGAERSSLAARISDQYGPGTDPNISLADGDDSDPDFTSEVIGRLSGREGGYGRYQLKGEVARGGQGAILRVWDEDLRRNLAMKVILGKSGADEGDTPPVDSKTLGRFLEEAQVTAQLDHPGIVPVHELGLDADGRVYFTMKLVKGEDLRAIFEKVKTGADEWSLTRALGVLLKVCEAMSYAHAKGVIHRDLKPGNVMVGRYGETYVMDWGLARVLGREARKDIRIRVRSVSTTEEYHSERHDRAGVTPDSPLITMDGDVVGTPSYMPPEQALGDIDSMGPHSDVYSIGAVLYELLTGQMPYCPPDARANNYAIWSRVQEGAPKPLEEIATGVPEELVAICEKAMAREIAQRYSDMEGLARDLSAFLEGRVVRAFEAGAWAETKKWVRRNRSLAASFAAAVLFAIVGLAGVGYVEAKGKRLAEEERDLANEARTRADVALAATERARASVLRLSALQDLEKLRERADQLWPVHPRHRSAYEKWLREAAEIAASLPEYRRHLRALRPWDIDGRQVVEIEDLVPPTAREIKGADASVVVQASWLYGQLEKLVAEIKFLVDDETGWIRGKSQEHGWGIERRLELLAEIEERSITGVSARRAWQRAIDSIANNEESPLYEGLKIEPQFGLLPIGRDLESGLWEFCHILSGEAAVRDVSGRVVLTANTGVVLILLPAGEVMGFVEEDGGIPSSLGINFGGSDAQITLFEIAEEQIEEQIAINRSWTRTPPFFFSKYEMTQGQWKRISGETPSLIVNYDDADPVHTASHKVGELGPLAKRSRAASARPAVAVRTMLHPVESVSWSAASRGLLRVQLELPNALQWVRASSEGDRINTGEWDSWVASTTGNTADSFAERMGAVEEGFVYAGDWQQRDDGYVYHAPVGSFPANSLGVHGLLGNVWEWTSTPSDVFDGSNLFRPGSVVVRGGGFASAAGRTTILVHQEERRMDLGIRAVRSLETEWSTVGTGTLSANELNDLAWSLVDPDRVDKETNVAFALRLARRAVKRAPDSAAIRDTLAWALFAHGFFEEAIAASEMALELAREEDKERFQGHRDRLALMIAE